MSTKIALRFIQTYLLVKYLDFLSKKMPKKFHKWQARRLKHQLKYYTTKSSYYHQYLIKSSIDDITSFPFMNKKILMDNFDEINTNGISLIEARSLALESERSRDFNPTLKGVSVGLSSGTTGNQGVFLASQDEIAMWSAAVIAKLVQFKKYRKITINIAFFMRANNNLYDSINKGKISLDFYDLKNAFEKNIQKLEQQQPNIIVAPPSMLRMIATYYKEYELRYDVKEIFSIAEVLDNIDAQYVSDVFNLKVKPIYQATEGFLACCCEAGHLHLNEDIVYIEKEYLDENKERFIPIITDLYRYTQPLIRYRLNDILVEDKTPCICRSCKTRLKKIEGREDDIFSFKKNETDNKIIVFPDFIRYAIINASSQISEFICIQQDDTTIEVQLDLIQGKEENNIIFSSVEKNIKKLLEEQEIYGININIVEGIKKRTQDVKLRRIISNVK